MAVLSVTRRARKVSAGAGLEPWSAHWYDHTRITADLKGDPALAWSLIIGDNTEFTGSLPEGYDHKYVYSHFGYNLKVTDMQAAVGCAQLEKFPEFVEKRKANFDRLSAGIRDLPQLRAFSKLPESDPSWFGFLMTVQPDAGFSRNDLAKFLESRNIQTRNLFAGNILRHPCFESLAEGVDYRVVGQLDNTETIMNDSLWIGLYPGMGDAKLEYMIKSIREFCGK